ncbi:MAG: glycerophosphodiester phosphodiesterase [Candidatus Kapaibacterium sp.]|nr:glycerophosphodiester phosphodiesterase [Ignavibacteriota bacterium]MCB9221663.1 glycerophosphodiester phosphodiesterase [Ignavibacteria bacterium]
MITIREFVQNNERFIIAHRGASGTMIENTMPAFQRAVDFGAKMLEVDIQVSSDKVPFAYHDANLKRINLDKNTSKLSSVEISEINLDLEKKEKISIPMLVDILRFCKDKEIYLIIEIKTNEDCSFNTEDVDIILDTVRSFGYDENCLFASFCVGTVQYIKSKDKEYNIASIALPDSTPKKLYEETKCDVYICSIEQLNESVVNECKDLGVYLGVYSADNEEQLETLLKFGINAIVTNYPERISKLLAARDDS